MGKIAFIFSGQGAQAPGMGKELCAANEEAASVFKALDAVRPGTSDMCFEGSEEDLRDTSNTQPCLFAVELSQAAALSAGGTYADMAAGFSLGELSALTYAGAMSLEEGFSLVVKRGRFMQDCSLKADTKMAAVVKLSFEKVEELAAKYEHVYPVNYNCPGQVSVAALSGEMEAFSSDVKAAGGRAIPLKVSGAFHSPFMKEAADLFSRELEGVFFSPLKIPVYSNVTGKPYEGDIKETLRKQIDSPVRWERIIKSMIEDGADTFIELGWGKTLCGFVKKIDPSVRVFTAQSKAELEEIGLSTRLIWEAGRDTER